MAKGDYQARDLLLSGLCEGAGFIFIMSHQLQAEESELNVLGRQQTVLQTADKYTFMNDH